MSKTRLFLCDLMANIAYGLLLCGAFAMPVMMYLLGAARGCVYGGFVMVPFMLCMPLRTYCKNFVLFCIAHAALGFGVVYLALLLTENSFAVAWIVIFMIVTVVISFNFRLSNLAVEISQGFILFAAIAFITAGCVVQHFMGINVFGLLSVFLVLIVAFFTLMVHFMNIAVALESAMNTEMQPIESIKKFNNRIIAFSVIVLILFLGLCMILPLDQFFASLLMRVKDFLVGLLSSNSTENVMPEVPFPVDSPINTQPDIFAMLRDNTGREPLVPQEVMQAIGVIIFLTTMGGLCFSLYGIYIKNSARQRVTALTFWKRLSLTGISLSRSKEQAVFYRFCPPLEAQTTKRRATPFIEGYGAVIKREWNSAQGKRLLKWCVEWKKHGRKSALFTARRAMRMSRLPMRN